jgi:hypothetical protein
MDPEAERYSAAPNNPYYGATLKRTVTPND